MNLLLAFFNGLAFGLSIALSYDMLLSFFAVKSYVGKAVIAGFFVATVAVGFHVGSALIYGG